MAENPRVALLVDEYDDSDWARLWWVRADGSARVHERHEHGLELLRERYAQYGAQPPDGPVIEVTVARWSGWSASG